jgi:hypothetical protein
MLFINLTELLLNIFFKPENGEIAITDRVYLINTNALLLIQYFDNKHHAYLRQFLS